MQQRQGQFSRSSVRPMAPARGSVLSAPVCLSPADLKKIAGGGGGPKGGWGTVPQTMDGPKGGW